VDEVGRGDPVGVHLSEYGADQGKRDRRTDRSYHGTKREIH
jgi:hypothetical protein